MKKSFLLAAAAAAFCLGQEAKAQTNLQVFYDFDRECISSTIEMFKGDNWGNTFFFVDYDYQLKQANGTTDSPASTYFEIARCLNFWQDSALGAFSAQIEYNGGVGTFIAPGERGFYGVNHAILAGVDYFAHSSDFRNTLNMKVLYKKFRNLEQKAPLQLTAVWGCQDLFGLKGVRFSGFADLWWESQAVFLSEPQIWYNVGGLFGVGNLHIGSEVELAYNFAGVSGFRCRPCLGAKWEF